MTDDRPEVTLRLSDDTIEQLADRLAARLAQHADDAQAATAAEAGLLSAEQVSQWWGVTRNWVYNHADDLGAYRLGSGRRPRLRFHPDRVRSALGDRDRPDR